MFFARLASTVFLLAAFFVAVFTVGRVAYATFGVLAMLVSYLSVRELCAMLKGAGRDSYPMMAATSAAATIALILIGRAQIAGAVILLLCAHSWLLLLFSKSRPEVLERVLNTVAIFFMLTIPFSLMATLYMGNGVSYEGRHLLLFLILVTKAGDMGAYAVGMLSNKLMKGGNHKMVPSISPGKSWEGAAGGLISSVGVSFLVAHYMNFQWMDLATGLLGVVLFLGGFTGDLAESSLKRVCGVKDSGKYLPGIGGVLDLVDSLLINAPVFYIYLSVLEFAR